MRENYAYVFDLDNQARIVIRPPQNYLNIFTKPGGQEKEM